MNENVDYKEVLTLMWDDKKLPLPEDIEVFLERVRKEGKLQERKRILEKINIFEFRDLWSDFSKKNKGITEEFIFEDMFNKSGKLYKFFEKYFSFVLEELKKEVEK